MRVRLRRWGVMIACALVVAATTSGVAADQPSAEPPIAEIGRLDVEPADAIAALGQRIRGERNPQTHELTTPTGTLIPVPEARLLVQVFPFEFQTRTVLAIRDLDSLRLLRSLVLDEPIRRFGVADSIGGEWAATYDPVRRRLYVYSGATIDLLEIDLDAAKVTRRLAWQSPIPQIPGSPDLRGLKVHDGAMWGLFSSSTSSFAVAASITMVSRLDLDTAAAEFRLIRECDGELAEGSSTTLGSPPFFIGETLYVVCHLGGRQGAVAEFPVQRALDPSVAPALIIGPPDIEGVLADPDAGRIFLLTKSAEIWAFDAASQAFVGVIAAGATPKPGQFGVDIGFGVDPASGRVLFQSLSYGFGIAEGRFFPIPQALTLPEHKASGQERLWVDPPTRRVFVLEGNFLQRSEHFRIYRLGNAPVPPPPPDPDRNTLDRAEKEGETEGRLFGTATGYGARTILAKGLTPTVPSPSYGSLTPIAQVVADNLNPNCGYTDRELIVGRVGKAEYDTGSAAAEAIAVDVDPRTKIDLEQPSRCDVPIRDPSGSTVFTGFFATAPALAEAVANPDPENPRWNRSPATCSASAGGQAAEGQGNDHGQPSLGSSHVECPLPGGELVAHAEGALVGGLTVGRSWTSTRIIREEKGVLATAEALALDIDIAGVVRIGEVRSVATSQSNGRSRTEPGSTHTITIRAVSVGGQNLCEVCDPEQLATTLTQIFGGRIEVRVGTTGADRALQKGSPKGALTAVQKSVQRQVSDQSLVGDFTNEVPGLEIIRYNDNYKWGRARQIIQLAAVGTAATYNIVAVPRFDGLEPGSVLGNVGGLPGAILDGMPVVGGSAGTAPATAAVPARSGARRGVIGLLGAVVGGGTDALGFVITRPREALLILTGWALLLLPFGLAMRRRLLLREPS